MDPLLEALEKIDRLRAEEIVAGRRIEELTKRNLSVAGQLRTVEERARVSERKRSAAENRVHDLEAELERQVAELQDKNDALYRTVESARNAYKQDQSPLPILEAALER